jgi:Lrp/AsnC family leucine-responsive transcriptional regulator
MAHLDKIDKLILASLQTDSAISNAELAEKVGLSPSACLSRTKNLKKQGIIKKYTAVIDERKVGFTVMAFSFVTLSPHNRTVAEAFCDQIQNLPQVVECYNITGNWDYLLKIVSPTIETYRDFIMDSLLTIDVVDKVETMMVLKSEKQDGGLPLS